MKRLQHLYASVLRGVLAGLIGLLLVVLVTQVVLRYGFGISLIWADEVSRHMLIWATFLGVALAYERGELAGVTMLRDALPRRAGLALAIFGNLLAIGLLVTLVIYGLRYADRIGHRPIAALRFLFGDLFGDRVPAPDIWWVYVALPVGLGLLALRFALDIVHYILLWRHGGRVGDLRAHPQNGQAA
ncbi:MAG: TRAP transporter small permease [Pararhodobacter sp.]|nr:TRAP transporter small permease [Pararhodobacter sp.]